VTVPVAERGSARQRSQGIGRAAVLIGTITMLARVIVTLAVPAHGFLPNVALTLMASAAVLAAFLSVVVLADGGDLRAVMRRVVRA
jgi:hypothetical protein